jgi:hypothetical protein
VKPSDPLIPTYLSTLILVPAQALGLRVFREIDIIPNSSIYQRAPNIEKESPCEYGMKDAVESFE